MKNQRKKEELPSITQLMEQTGKSREAVLEMLNLTVPKRVLDTFSLSSGRDAVKQAKKQLKSSLPGESLIKFFDHKLPNWGSIVFNSMRIKTL